MKNKSLWIILLVLMIVVVCGLIVSVLGIGIFSFTSISSVSNSVENLGERFLNGEVFNSSDFSVQASEEKTFLVGSENITLVVENQFGDVVVQGVETDEISMSVLKTAYGISEAVATENLDSLQYEVIEEPGRLTIRVLDQDQMLNNPGSIDFKMDVPVNTNIVFSTNMGDLYAGNVVGDVDLHSSFGDVEVRDMQDGELNADTNSGKVTLRGINVPDDSITVNTQFGDVNIFQANARSLSVSSSNGAMNLENVIVSGDIDLTDNFGSVGYRKGEARNVNIKSSNGKLTLNGITIENKLVAHTDFGDIEIGETLAAAYDLDTKNGKVNLNGTENAEIKVSSDFGELVLTNISNSLVDAETKNGAISFSGSLAEGNHRIISDFGAITLQLPANQSIDCDIKTSFGKISSEFDLTISGEIDEKHFVGKINDGGGLLTVETQNGNISLEKTMVGEE